MERTLRDPVEPSATRAAEASFYADDGADPVTWRLAPGVTLGTPVRAGQLVAYMGDSGNSEGSVPHLHFEIHRPDGSPINPYDSLRQAEDAARCFWLPGLAELT